MTENRVEPAGRERVAEQHAYHHGVTKQLAILLSTFAAIGIALVNRDVLPAKFFLDDVTIQAFIDGRKVSGFSAYQTTADLYRLLGLGDHPELVGIVTVLVFTLTILVALGWGRIREANGWSILFACVSIVLSSVYLAQYSKEFFVLGLILIFFATRGRRFGDVVFIAAMLLYAGFVRDYWFVVAALFVGGRILLPRLKRVGTLILVELLAIAALVIASNIVLGESLTQSRLDANQNLVIDRASEIHDFIVDTSIPAQYLNGLLILVTLLIPLPLLFAGSIVHIVSLVLITALWCAIIVRLVRHLRSGALRSNTALASAYALVIAMVTVQMMFEPDYGSYLRHLTPILPVFVFCLNDRKILDRFAPRAIGNETIGARR